MLRCQLACTLAHALSNGPWKGLYLADEDAPHQYQSNSCGVFMLMEVVVGQLLETFMLEGPAELAGSFSPSPSPHLSHTFQSLSSESPAGLAGTPSSPSPSPHLSHTLQSGTTEDRPFLPPEVLQQIVQETLRLDMAMLGVFNRVSNTFRELIKPLHPSIYINDSLAGDIKLNKDNLIYITVRKIYNNAGCGSGLALRLKGFSKKKNWPSAPLVLRHVAYGRFVIKDFCLA
ncbi:unnamed protein product [Arctogadus glacialis]